MGVPVLLDSVIAAAKNLPDPARTLRAHLGVQTFDSRTGEMRYHHLEVRAEMFEDGKGGRYHAWVLDV